MKPAPPVTSARFTTASLPGTTFASGPRAHRSIGLFKPHFGTCARPCTVDKMGSWSSGKLQWEDDRGKEQLDASEAGFLPRCGDACTADDGHCAGGIAVKD